MENSETEDVNLETGWKPQVCSEPLKEDEWSVTDTDPFPGQFYVTVVLVAKMLCPGI
jgi:hypothetical protein